MAFVLAGLVLPVLLPGSAPGADHHSVQQYDAATLSGDLLQGPVQVWQREHQRRWRDIRLSVCNEFLAANRRYVAHVLDPGASITAVPHPREPGRLMPFFNETGRPYKEALEAGFTAMRLVTQRPETVRAGVLFVNCAREVAAARATLSETDIPSQAFERLWAAEQDFINAVRAELGLTAMPRQP